MRGTLEDLPTPHPVGGTLPGVYLDDDLTQRLCAALDTVLAPVITTLDSLGAYLDPDTAPADLLDWLAGWVALSADGARSVPEQRRLIRGAAQLHARRGTAAGIADAVTLLVGGEVEVSEGGGTAWSATPGAALPGSGDDRLVVRVRLPGATEQDLARLESLVDAVTPAHLPHEVDVVT